MGVERRPLTVHDETWPGVVRHHQEDSHRFAAHSEPQRAIAAAHLRPVFRGMQKTVHDYIPIRGVSVKHPFFGLVERAVLYCTPVTFALTEDLAMAVLFPRFSPRFQMLLRQEGFACREDPQVTIESSRLGTTAQARLS